MLWYYCFVFFTQTKTKGKINENVQINHKNISRDKIVDFLNKYKGIYYTYSECIPWFVAVLCTLKRR